MDITISIMDDSDTYDLYHMLRGAKGYAESTIGHRVDTWISDLADMYGSNHKRLLVFRGKDANTLKQLSALSVRYDCEEKRIAELILDKTGV